MASNKPVLHGRDHLPGHPDPIPGLAELIAATALTHAEGKYQIDSEDGTLDIVAGSGAYIDWAFIAGDAVLDLTDPDAPKVVQSGFYIVEATIAVEDGITWTNGASVDGQLQFHGVRLKNQRNSAPVSDVDANPGGQIQVSLSGHLRSGLDTIDLFITNNDSITHTFTVDSAEVSMVYSTTP